MTGITEFALATCCLVAVVALLELGKGQNSPKVTRDVTKRENRHG